QGVGAVAGQGDGVHEGGGSFDADVADGGAVGGEDVHQAGGDGVGGDVHGELLAGAGGEGAGGVLAWRGDGDGRGGADRHGAGVGRRGRGEALCAEGVIGEARVAGERHVEGAVVEDPR